MLKQLVDGDLWLWDLLIVFLLSFLFLHCFLAEEAVEL